MGKGFSPKKRNKRKKKKGKKEGKKLR